ncbi:Flp family type IVb pilin [Nocardioides sp.]|uniref:Flp family type IVb pilin n=1 Tax=Nocardioides sp. TaxID=35761 RepID=UPI0039E6AFDA
MDDERGASAIEYGLLISAIATVILVSSFFLYDYISDIFSGTCTSITTHSAAAGGSTHGQCEG